MIKLTLKDGSIKEIESAMPAYEVIKGIGMGLYKAACIVKINGEVKGFAPAGTGCKEPLSRG